MILASTPPDNEAFLREVDDELRRDQLQSFWKRWGRWLVGGLIGGLALFAGYLWWQNDKAIRAGVEGETLSQALDALGAGDSPQAVAQLKTLAASKIPGYRASAKLALAALALQHGDIKRAATGFGDVAGDDSLAQPWRDLALVRQTATEFDTLKPDAVIARLKSLSVAGSPWFGSAGEMVAMSYLKLGKPELAAKIFGDMAKDEQVPETIRSRAIQMAGGLGAGVAPVTGKEIGK